MAVEQVARHGGACAAAAAAATRGDGKRSVTRSVRSLGKLLLDFALPPRCAGCGEVIEEVGAFCAACWGRIEWLGNAGCQRCGLPLAGTEAETCARCLADPPKLDRMRAAVAYDELPRSIALRLKYGRKVALARTMARYMAPLKGDWDGDALLIPVPLHRWRLWGRGLQPVAAWSRGELGAVVGLVQPTALCLRRIKRTQPLKGMSHGQRRKASPAHSPSPTAERIKRADGRPDR